jgi:transcriptional regulator with XRE-family HTH domain
LLETAGLRQSDVAERAEMSRYYLSHIAAGRRNLSGATAARIAAIYGDTKGISQEEATELLFVVVAEKKHGGSPRKRGERGRFVKE